METQSTDRPCSADACNLRDIWFQLFHYDLSKDFFIFYQETVGLSLEGDEGEVISLK